MTRRRNNKRKQRVIELIRSLRKVCPQFIGETLYHGNKIEWKNYVFFIRLTRTNEWILTDKSSKIIMRTISEKKVLSYLRTLVLINS